MARLASESRRRRRDHELGDPVEVEPRARRLRQRQHHGVVSRNQRCECGDALAKNARAVLWIEALAAINGGDRPAIGEGAEEVERVGVAHRHDEQRAVVAMQAEFDLGDERQHGATAMIAYRALWGASCTGRVHEHPRIFWRHRNLRLPVACAGHQLLVGDVPGRALPCPKPDSTRRLHRELRSNILQGSDKLVLDDDGGGLGVIHNVADFLADQAEVERHRDQPRFGRSRINLDPFDGVVR